MATSPATSFARLRPDLRDTLMEFDLAADRAGFVGLKIAPALEVEEPAGEYGKIELKELLKSRDTRRANDGSYARGDGKGTKDNYSTEEHGFEERVDEREARMFDDWWDAEQLATERCRDVVLRNHNQRVIDLALAVGNTNAAGTAWTNLAASDPIANVAAAKRAMRDRCGYVPNVMVIDWDRFEVLRDNDKLVERIKYAGFQNPNRENINAAALAQAFDLDEVVISGSLKNNANENQAASLASMWDKTKALLFRRSTGRDLKSPQFMRTFHWGADGSKIGGVVEEYREEARRSDVIRCRMETDEKVVYAAVAQLITGI